MTVEHVTAVDTWGQPPLFRAGCQCGWKQPNPTTSKGAAAFSASAHVKKANGLPVFGPKVERALGTIEAIATASLAANGSSVEEVAAIVGDVDWGQMTLPATLHTVPSDEYRVTGYRTFRGRYEGEGSGYEAILERKVDGRYRKAADIAYYGDGGEVEITFIDDPRVSGVRLVEIGSGGAIHADGDEPREPGGKRRMTGPRQSPETNAFGAWCERFEGKWDEKLGLDWCFAGVVDVLIGELDMRNRLNRTSNLCLLLKGDDPRRGWRTLTKSSGAARARGLAQVKRQHPDARVWNGEAWVPVQVMA